MKKNYLLGMVGALITITIICSWIWLGYPDSLNQARFNWRISNLSDQTRTVSLTELMPGDWEDVCYSHGYSSPIYLDKYRKFYGPIGKPTDQAWGLIFIAPDGSSTAAHGSCESNRVLIDSKGSCVSRKRAVLKADLKSNSCSTYSLQALDK